MRYRIINLFLLAILWQHACHDISFALEPELCDYVWANAPQEPVVTINEEKKQKWIDAHPKKYRKMAEKLAAEIRLVSLSEFFKSFDASLQPVLDAYKDKKLVFTWLDSSNDIPKSGDFLAGRIRAMHPNLKARFIPVRKINRGELSPDEIVVPFDDASYSGAQIEAILKILRKDLDFKGGISVVIPYMTTVAKKTVKSFQANWLEAIEIKTLEEIIDQWPAEEKSLKKLVENTYVLTEGATLTLFEHKAADSISFFNPVFRGEIPREDKYAPEQYFAFIEDKFGGIYKMPIPDAIKARVRAKK